MQLDLLMGTRNRPEQAMLSLESVLGLARNPNVRVVVSDNSDEKSAQLRDFCEQNGLDYVHPPKVLAMSAHWDWLLGQVQGEALHILTDRGYLLERELIASWDSFREHGLPVLFGSATFKSRPVMGLDFFLASSLRYSGLEVEVPNAQVLQTAAKGRCPWALPRLMNGIFPRDALSHLREKFGVICESVSPDVEFGNKLLMTQSGGSLIYRDRIGKLSHSNHLSNGATFDQGKDNAAQADFKKLNSLIRYEHSPRPEDLGIASALAHEFNRVAVMLGRIERVDEAEMLAEKDAREGRRQAVTGIRRHIKRISTLTKTDPTHQLYVGLGGQPADFDSARIRYTGDRVDLEANLLGERGL